MGGDQRIGLECVSRVKVFPWGLKLDEVCLLFVLDNLTLQVK